MLCGKFSIVQQVQCTLVLTRVVHQHKSFFAIVFVVLVVVTLYANLLFHPSHIIVILLIVMLTLVSMARFIFVNHTVKVVDVVHYQYSVQSCGQCTNSHH